MKGTPDDPDDDEQVEVAPADTDRVFVDVTAYNSKVYYVQGDVASPGRMPITGNETVLDAINYAGGLMATAAPSNIRLVRPAPPGACCEQVLPVNLAAIISAGDPTTNYQLMPGDRLFIAEDELITFNNVFAKVTAPFERLAGVLSLGNSTIRGYQTLGRDYNKTRSGY